MASRSAKKMPHMKKTKEHLYNAQGAPEAGEAMDETPGFHKGGKTKKHMKRKDGGKAEGHEAKHRADHKKRGGHAHHAKGGHAKKEHEGHHKRADGGRTPYSTGSKTSMPSESGKTNTGHESERP